MQLRQELLPALESPALGDANREDRTGAIRLALIFVPLILAAAALPFALFGLGIIPRWLFMAAMLPLSVVEFIVAVRIGRRAQAGRIARRLAARDRCGSCAHDLTGLRRDADGCRCCPECGAAWQ